MALWVKHLQHRNEGQNLYKSQAEGLVLSNSRMQEVETEDPWGELARLAEIVSSKLSKRPHLNKQRGEEARKTIMLTLSTYIYVHIPASTHAPHIHIIHV